MVACTGIKLNDMTFYVTLPTIHIKGTNLISFIVTYCPFSSMCHTKKGQCIMPKGIRLGFQYGYHVNNDLMYVILKVFFVVHGEMCTKVIEHHVPFNNHESFISLPLILL